MRYIISVRNQNANQPLVFHSVGGAVETTPAPVTPNIPAGGTAEIKIRVKQNAINPATPAGGGTGEIYYTRQDGNIARYYKVILMRTTSTIIVQRTTVRVGDPRTFNFQAHNHALGPNQVGLLANKFVHLGDVRLRVAF